MTRDDIFTEDRGERKDYTDAFQKYKRKGEVLLPLTKDGFEALLEIVAGISNLPFDDAARSVIAGYVHHITNEQNTVSFETLHKVLWKSISNSTTWRIDQEIKLKKREEAQKLAEEMAKDNVIQSKEENGIQS